MFADSEKNKRITKNTPILHAFGVDVRMMQKRK